jgi:hypothetical protein
MDEKDGRRSRVPAGTFGGSDPPTGPTSEPAASETAGNADRKRFTSTLTGKDGSAEVELDDAEVELPEAPAHRKRTGNTLVGHPSVPPPPPPNAPVLAPPKWRGAKPYLEGEEPQPQVSSIVTPPPAPGTPSGRPEGIATGAMRSKVTTKVGQPPPPQAPTAAIDDTIQRMLEGQASVPMQVEEPLDIAALPEIPLNELPIEMLADSSPRLPPSMVAAARARAQESAATRATERAASVDRPADAASPRPLQGSDPAPSAKASDADGGFGFASSVAPAEVTRRPRRGDSQAGLGWLALGVFTIVFAGGWLLTRGGYSGMQRKPATVSAPAASAKPSGPSDLAPAPAAALTTPDPAIEAADRAMTASEASERASRAAARRPRAKTSSEPSGTQTEGESPAAARRAGEPDSQSGSEPSTLTVKPRLDPANLPDIPSRDDVISALEPLRGAIGECVHGMRGVAQLDITVSSSGSVSHAVVGGDFAGTPEGSCIARATRGAQFTPFKKPRFRVIYPFSL